MGSHTTDPGLPRRPRPPLVEDFLEEDFEAPEAAECAVKAKAPPFVEDFLEEDFESPEAAECAEESCAAHQAKESRKFSRAVVAQSAALHAAPQQPEPLTRSWASVAKTRRPVPVLPPPLPLRPCRDAFSSCCCLSFAEEDEEENMDCVEGVPGQGIPVEDEWKSVSGRNCKSHGQCGRDNTEVRREKESKIREALYTTMAELLQGRAAPGCEGRKEKVQEEQGKERKVEETRREAEQMQQQVCESDKLRRVLLKKLPPEGREYRRKQRRRRGPRRN